MGEIWGEAQRWLEGDQSDAVMNYLFARASLGFFGRETFAHEYRPGGFGSGRCGGARSPTRSSECWRSTRGRSPRSR